MTIHTPIAVGQTDLLGRPYTPAKQRAWLNAALRADIAHQMACDPAEVEYRLDARERMDAAIAERREYEDPYGYERGRRW